MLIAEYFGEFVGRFLDIGALDGKTGSTTCHLRELGWGGVVVDTTPRAMIDLNKRYGRDSTVEIVQAAITKKRGLIPFWDCPDTAHSTASKRLFERGCGREGAIEMMVSGITIADLFEALPGPYDFISIDIEDCSVEVLEDLDLLSVDCRLLCVECFPAEVLGTDEEAAILAAAGPDFKKLARTNPGNLLLERR